MESAMPNFSQEKEAVAPQSPDPVDEVIRLQTEFNRVQDLYLRALADLDNFRKKVQQDHTKIAHLGKREILLKILEVVDSFNRALQHTSGLPESLAEGFHVISRQLQNILTSEGVTPMETLGHTFDPNLHEAIAAVGDEARASGMIVAELSRGYLWRDELLRPAKVSVAP
jgi:molecular chaperone GrpE